MPTNYLLVCGSNKNQRLTINDTNHQNDISTTSHHNSHQDSSFPQLTYAENLSHLSIRQVQCTKTLTWILLSHGALLCFGFESGKEKVFQGASVKRIAAGEQHLVILTDAAELYIIHEEEIMHHRRRNTWENSTTKTPRRKYCFDSVYEWLEDEFQDAPFSNSITTTDSFSTMHASHLFKSISQSRTRPHRHFGFCDHERIETENGFILHHILKDRYVKNFWSTSIGTFVLVDSPQELWSFGERNDYGQLGLLPWSGRSRPQGRRCVDLSFLQKNEQIECIDGGREHTILVTDRGRVFGCGSNAYGMRAYYSSQTHEFTRIPLEGEPTEEEPEDSFPNTLLSEKQHVISSNVDDVQDPLDCVEPSFSPYKHLSRSGGVHTQDIAPDSEDGYSSDDWMHELSYENLFMGTYTLGEMREKLRKDSVASNKDIREKSSITGNSATPPLTTSSTGTLPPQEFITSVSCGSYHTILRTRDQHVLWLFGRNARSAISLDESIWYHHRKSKEIRIPIRITLDFPIQNVFSKFDQTFVVDEKCGELYAVGESRDYQLGLNRWTPCSQLEKVPFPTISLLLKKIWKRFQIGVGEKHTVVLVDY